MHASNKMHDLTIDDLLRMSQTYIQNPRKILMQQLQDFFNQVFDIKKVVGVSDSAYDIIGLGFCSLQTPPPAPHSKHQKD